MDKEELFELIEFVDDNELRVVTDDLVIDTYMQFASAMNNCTTDEVINFLLEEGYTVDWLANALQEVGIIQEEPDGFSG
tara:strand:- start:35 stop:271 length:237 start_codon:yes stop_codon:yes gene_type:complete